MLPDLTVLWVVALVLALAMILDRLIFRPILSVIKRREDAVDSARQLAEQAANEARQAGEEFERRTQAARSEIYRQVGNMRGPPPPPPAALVEETRRETERVLADARAELAREVEAARARLDADADTLAAAATERILGRRAS
jgi:F-type H+-transporting ATPase subunit b